MAYDKVQKDNKVNYKNNNTKNFYSSKDRDNIYEVKQYPKKQKNRNTFFDIPIPEYELERARQRQKREIDQKKSKNRKYRQYEDY